MNAELPQPPGHISHPDNEQRALNNECKQTQVSVRNEGDHLVQIGSHYHFFEVNPALGFDRIAAFGKRLDLPAGDRVYFPPGEIITVPLIPFEGNRRITSFYGVVNGSIDNCDPHDALERLEEKLHEPLAPAPEEETHG